MKIYIIVFSPAVMAILNKELRFLLSKIIYKEPIIIK